MIATLLCAAALAQASTPTLAEVIQRARAYVVAFQAELSGIVAEETYRQDYRVFRSMNSPLRSQALRRELKSDLLVVKPIRSERWMQFRDVFAVDGRPVRDRSERLLDLFLKPDQDTRRNAQRIADESARFNVGEIRRNINVPMMALQVLLNEHAGRFAFTRTDKATADLIRERVDDVWVVEFKEDRHGTMIRTTNDGDLPTHGRLWIEPATGRIRLTELVADNIVLRATIDVRYGPGPQESLLVPLEMRELYVQGNRGERIEGEATYGRFRQFQVSVDEHLAPVKK